MRFWEAPGCPGLRELNSLGAAGCCDGVAEAFIGRLVYSLGLKVSPGKFSGLSQAATEWAEAARCCCCMSKTQKRTDRLRIR
eukprot:685280-Amphidinium_carterae.1